MTASRPPLPLSGFQVSGDDSLSSNDSLAPGLYLVATPIGNLGDITVRALQVLAQADVIYCEDQRVTAKLLTHYGIQAKCRLYHDHNGERMRPQILAQLKNQARLALVSDAGSPLVADPGFKLVREVVAAGQAVYSIPGPSAVIAGLQISGLASDRFLFAGFLPARQAQRRRTLEDVQTSSCTVIFYETARRIRAALQDMFDVLGNRPVAVCREMTKHYEETLRGPLAEVIDLAADMPLKGEIVVIIAPADPGINTGADFTPEIWEHLQQLCQTTSLSQACSQTARAFGLDRKALYKAALKEREKAPLQTRGDDD